MKNLIKSQLSVGGQLKSLISLFSLIFILATNCFSQNNQAADSLQNLLSATREDTIKVNLLNNIALQYMDKDYPKALDYSIESSKLAAQINWDRGLAYAYRNIGMAYLNLKDPNNAIDFHEKSLALADKIGDRILEAKEYGNIGNAYHNLSNDDQALDQYRRASEIIDTLRGNPALKIALLISEGNLYESKCDYASAIASQMAASDTAFKYGLTDRQALALNNMAGIYIKMSDFPNAIRYANQSLQLSSANGLTTGILMSLGNLGQAYQHLKNNALALSYYKRSLSIALQYKDNSSASLSLSNIGTIYSDTGKYDLALKYLNQALATAVASGREKVIEAKTLNQIGFVYYKQGQIKKALASVYSSMQIAQTFKIMDSQLDNWRLLNIIFEHTGKTDSAYAAFKKYIAIKDIAMNRDTVNSVLRHEIKYNNDLNKLQNGFQSKEFDKKFSLEVYYKRLAVLTVCMLATWIVISYLFYKRKEKNIARLFSKFLKTNQSKNAFIIFCHFVLFFIFQLISYKKDEFMTMSFELLNSVSTICVVMMLNLKPVE